MNMKVLFKKNGPLLFTIGAGISLVAAAASGFKAGGETVMDYTNAKLDIDAINDELEEQKARTEDPEVIENLEKDADKAIKEIKRDFCLYLGKNLLLPVGFTVGGLFCLINSHKMNMKHIAAIGAGYTALQSRSKSIQKKAGEFIGEYKEDEFREELAKDWIDRSPVPDTGAMEETGKGDTLFYDSLSGKYFLSDKEDVEEAIRLAKADMGRIKHKDKKINWMTLNEWYFNYLGASENELGNWLRFNPDTFDVTLEMSQTLDRAVSPYTYVLMYNDVPDMLN